MKIVVTMLLLLGAVNLNAQVSMEWVKSFNGTQQEVGKSIATDNFGNVYTSGYFTGIVDFDPSSNLFILSSLGQQDIFISKLDINGNFLWAKKMGGIGNDVAYSLALDTVGNIYTTGFFSNSVDFDPGIGIFNISSVSAASQDIFVSKLDALGNFVWAKSFGGTGYYDSLSNMYDAIATGYSIAIDFNNTICIAGSFLGTIDFNPGGGIYNMASLSVSNIFVTKLNSLGDFVWAKKMGECKHGDEAYSIAIDNAGNIYSCGVFGDTADFDPDTNQFQLISNASKSAFVSKLDSSGNFIWAKKIGGVASNDQAVGYALQIDVVGNIITSGYFKGSLEMNSTLFNSLGNYDVFIAKLNSAGSFIWVKIFGGTLADYCYSLATDNNSNIYLSGSFKGSVDFDPGINVTTLSSCISSTSDIFLSKLNSSGDFLWASKMGGTGNDLANSIYINPAENIMMTGYFSNSANFNPQQNTGNIISAGSVDAFILKLNQNSMMLPLSLKDFSGIQVKAGNLLKWQTENEVNSNYFEVQKINKEKKFSTIGILECLMNATSKSNYTFLDHTQFEGKNYYRLKQVDLDHQFTYSEIISIQNDLEREEEVIVYPNPCKGELNILTSRNILKGVLKISDVNGQAVIEKKNISGQLFNYDISSLMNGIYFIEIIESINDEEVIKKSKIDRVRFQLAK